MALTWSAETVETLLFQPTRLLDDPAWSGWLEASGGLEAVLTILAALPLTPRLAALRDVILAQPDTPWHVHVAALDLHPATYYRQRKALVAAVLTAAHRGAFPDLALGDGLPDFVTANPAPLPTPSTSLVGREDAIADVTSAIRDHAARLVTLTGTGGIGKTRLSIAAARALEGDYPDGASFVSLADLINPDDVPAAIAQRLAIPTEAATPVLTTLQNALAFRTMLLVLDNFEHLLPAASVLPTLLDAAPNLALLVTSRAPLQLPNEQRLAVPPLAVPEPDDSLMALPELAESAHQWPQLVPDALPAEPTTSASVQLFLERATLPAAPDAAQLDRIATLCRRLDGLPLAIELAAAQTATSTLDSVLEQLDAAILAVQQPGAEARHITLDATLAWSYERLRPRMQRWFRLLSVFVGGWDMAAMQAVGEADAPECHEALLALLAASLVQRETTEQGEVRFRMLEVVRVYAEKLRKRNERESYIIHNFCEFFLNFANIHGTMLNTYDHANGIKNIQREYTNIRNTLILCFNHRLMLNQCIDFIIKNVIYWQNVIDPQEINIWITKAYHSSFFIEDTIIQNRIFICYIELQIEKNPSIGLLETIFEYSQIPELSSYIKAKIYKILSNCYHDKGYIKKAMYLLKSAIKYFYINNLILDLANSYMLLSIFYRENHDYMKAKYIISKAIIIAQNTNNITYLYSYIHNLGLISLYERDFNKSLFYFNIFLEKYPLHLNRKSLFDLYNNLGALYFFKKDLQKSYYYFKLSFDQSIKSGYESSYTISTLNMASITRSMNNIEKHFYYITKLIDISFRYNLKYDIIAIPLTCAFTALRFIKNPKIGVMLLSMTRYLERIWDILPPTHSPSIDELLVEASEQLGPKWKESWNAMQALTEDQIRPTLESLIAELQSSSSLPQDGTDTATNAGIK